MSDISDEIYQAARAVLEADPKNARARLKETLQRFIRSNFAVCSGSIVDESGNRSSCFSIIVCRVDSTFQPGDQKDVPADRVAAVVEFVEEIDLTTFQQAYARISKVKQLAKTPVLRGETRTNITLGIVFALRTRISLDSLADELFRLNAATPHRAWIDMLVVAPHGVLNYAVQFPGELLSGDFLPPAEGAFRPPAPPAIYVTIVMRPTGPLAINKLVAFLVGHLVFFAPDVANTLPNGQDILVGQPSDAITTRGFQPNVRGEFVPVPEDGYSGQFIPRNPILLEDARGEVLVAINFFKWQEGGVILSTGKLPLEGLLFFLPNVKPEFLRVMRRPTHQISPVLPISEIEFRRWLANIQRQSDLKISNRADGIVMQKYMDEGTSTPFIARCTLGLLRVRANIFKEESARLAFDRIFQSSLASIMAARTARNDLSRHWINHQEGIASGELAKIEGRNIRVLENINKDLSTKFETFLNAGARSIKTGVQSLCSNLGIDIGFLFKKTNAFHTGVERLKAVDPHLAEYLVHSRAWTERLILLRNNLEHEVWEFPRVTYALESGRVAAKEPSLSGEAITVTVATLFDRIACFFEEMIAHGLQRNLPAGISITEIPLQQRTREAPERFRITVTKGGELPWKITYHQEHFEDV
ncbi:DUF6602 domain-containing protein [Bradyrhizobium sp. AZCC 1721]|uniref:DUF6602 domain-containing protein n=1 Tax=Bradyrhizobium sp. AZCC 1721 TaxID=3117016 RepID=UPI002FF05ECC